MILTGKILIVGDGECAGNAAREFSGSGIATIIAGRSNAFGRTSDVKQKEHESVEIYRGAEIVACEGCVNDFHVSLKVEGKTVSIDVAAIVITEEYDRIANFDLYGLKPAKTVIPVSDLPGNDETISGEKDRFKKGGKTLFLTGVTRESNPVVLEEVMRKALMLQQKFDQKIYILTGNLKVAGDGLESLCRQTREAGILTIKFNKTVPKLEQKNDGSVTVLFEDEIIRESITLSPDLVVVDETLLPSPYFENLAAIFELEKDENGFLQSENVHRSTVLTNRRGVLAVGPARGIMSLKDHATDIVNAVLVVTGSFRGEKVSPGRKAEIGPFECARCITCLRICPYKAIRLGKRVEICADACEGCGICAAECPRTFITMTGPGISDNLKKISINRVSDDSKEFTPAIVAFCCTRSAVKSGRLASEMGIGLSEELKIVEVPCAGGVSMDHILKAFLAGADGVLMLTCHIGNCHSDIGNVYAKTRAENVSERLLVMGFEKERLLVRTIAPNMGREFTEITKGFEQVIRKLGPSKIRRSLKSG
jgi:coenzyme F420-reducing hydrogenase delta subunit/Pyruvate/2-oxoacid:ferredoxin oxidoreductase delta subunit